MNYKDILSYWYNNPLDYNKWFFKSSDYDNEIIKKFYKIHEQASEGHLLHWLNKKESYLALIIILDQFSRHINRNNSKAFENDDICILFTQMGLHFLQEMTANQIIFVMLPFQHSENIKDSDFQIKILNNFLKREQNVKEKNILKKSLYHAKKARKVLKTFNRYPKRNKHLKRENTEEEVDYLDENTEFHY
jgi:uncharacterized protein (DUF924 family)